MSPVFEAIKNTGYRRKAQVVQLATSIVLKNCRHKNLARVLSANSLPSRRPFLVFVSTVLESMSQLGLLVPIEGEYVPNHQANFSTGVEMVAPHFTSWWPHPPKVRPLPALSYGTKSADGSTASHQLGLAACNTLEFHGFEPVWVGICQAPMKINEAQFFYMLNMAFAHFASSCSPLKIVMFWGKVKASYTRLSS